MVFLERPLKLHWILDRNRKSICLVLALLIACNSFAFGMLSLELEKPIPLILFCSVVLLCACWVVKNFSSEQRLDGILLCVLIPLSYVVWLVSQEHLFFWKPNFELKRIVLFVFLLLVPPVYEELVFRGLLQNWLMQRTKPAIAILVTAVIFVASHLTLQPIYFFSAFLLGLIYAKYRRIEYAISMHFCHNLVAESNRCYYEIPFCSRSSPNIAPELQVPLGTPVIILFFYKVLLCAWLFYTFFWSTRSVRSTPLQ
jgi:membrane protease YdiL (CAAX protease family)